MENNFVLNDGQEVVKMANSPVRSFFNTHPKVLTALLYFALAVFIQGLFFIVYAIKGVYPFGSATISSYDMSAQVAPFIEHFFDVINGKSSLFYTFAVAGGADVFGTLAYCCISPFTWIFLLFGEGNVYYGTSIVLPLKIICVAFSGLFYVRKRFKNLPITVQLALALSYAFCGYLFVSNTYINWVDLLIYLPFLALGFNKIVQNGKKWLFVLSLCLMIYTCFSISCFSLFIIYPIILLYCALTLTGEKRKEVLVNSILALVCAIFFSLPVLLPALKAFMVSGRKGGLFENMGASYSVSALYYKVSYLFTDGLTLFFTFAYFVKYGFKRAIDRFIGLAGLILLIPVFFDESMNLLNMGSYMSYSLRFGFLNGFYFLYVASSFINSVYLERVEAEKQPYVLTNNQPKSNFISCLVIFVLFAGFLTGLYFLNKGIENQTFVEWFSNRFAHSLGGLEATAIIFGCIAIIVLLAGFLVYKRKLYLRIFNFILLAVVLIQSAFYGYHLVIGNHYIPTEFDQIGALTTYVKTLEDSDDTRVKMNGDYLTACMPFTLHTNSFSVFSSVINAKNFIAPIFFGYSGNGKNSMKSYGSSYFADCVLGYEYYINDGRSSKVYLTLVEGCRDLTDESGNAIDVGNYYLYKNENVFPHAFVTSNAQPQEDLKGIAKDYDSLLKLIGGEEFGIEWANLTVTELSDGTFKLRAEISEPGHYYFVSDFKNAKDVKYSRNSYTEENAKELYSNEGFSLGSSSGNSGSFNLYLKSKTSSLTKDEILSSCKAFKVSNAVVKQIHDKLVAQQVEFSVDKTQINVKANASEGDYLYLNYVALEGHSVTVNGRTVTMQENLLGFMMIPLEAGVNEVKIAYQSPYVKLILIGLAVALAFALLYYLLVIKGKKFLQIFTKPLFIIGIVVGVILVGFFFVFPVLLCAYKAVVLLVKTIGSLIAKI